MIRTFLSYTVNNYAADDLATQGAKASTAMVSSRAGKTPSKTTVNKTKNKPKSILSQVKPKSFHDVCELLKKKWTAHLCA